MAGDRQYQRYWKDICLLSISLVLMVCADHLLLLLAGWACSNLIFVRLMIHKKEWAAAQYSGILALKTFAIGIVLLGIGFYLLVKVAGTASIHSILAMSSYPHSITFKSALILIIGAAMTQSAIWPFYRWLTSSLNSPTPVSALMHAGLVNGGGFLLIRFAPLYFLAPFLLHLIYGLGFATLILGTLWKLVQTDIKRMLACSTMGQMGFMFMECGMGLFPLALSHLVWHGLFKSYLFLNSGSAVEEIRRKDCFSEIPISSFTFALILGLLGAYAFASASGNIFNLHNTSEIILGLGFMACAQLAMHILGTQISLVKVISALILIATAGALYGESIYFIDDLVAPLNLFKPQPLDSLYISGFVMMFLVWIAMNMNITSHLQKTRLWRRFYMWLLNGSQPDPKTITSNRNTYHF